MDYKFYNAKKSNVWAKNFIYPNILLPRDLYEALSDIWCEYSCAPRMRKDWSKDNKTLGQCSITAFLVQDIFGGEVYGVPLEDGSYHCYNVVDDHIFDLTSEQFGDKELEYKKENPQDRLEHFKSVEKYQRYLYLTEELIKWCLNHQ